MRKPLAIIALALGFATGACQTTSGPSAGSSMELAGAALPPSGYVDFCKRYPSDCTRTSEAAGPLQLDAQRWGELQRVNGEVNRTIRYVSDGAGRSETWEYPTEAGDCEDFVLEKRRRLIEAGWPEQNLLIAVAQVPRVGAHAVLVAVTSGGDYVLDVRESSVRRWEDVDYRWLKRQSAENPKIWMNIRNA